MITTTVTARTPVAAGGGSCSGPACLASVPGDVLGNSWSAISGVWNWGDSTLKTFTNNSPSRADYQTTVITIALVGLVLALLLVSASSVAKVAAVVR